VATPISPHRYSHSAPRRQFTRVTTNPHPPISLAPCRTVFGAQRAGEEAWEEGPGGGGTGGENIDSSTVRVEYRARALCEKLSGEGWFIIINHYRLTAAMQLPSEIVLRLAEYLRRSAI